MPKFPVLKTLGNSGFFLEQQQQRDSMVPGILRELTSQVTQEKQFWSLLTSATD